MAMRFRSLRNVKRGAGADRSYRACPRSATDVGGHVICNAQISRCAELEGASSTASVRHDQVILRPRAAVRPGAPNVAGDRIWWAKVSLTINELLRHR